MDIDNLAIEIQTNTDTKSLEKLSKNLKSLKNLVSSFDFSNAIKNSNSLSASLSRLGETVGSLNSKLSKTATGFNSLSDSMSMIRKNFSGLDADIGGIKEIEKIFSKLGGKYISQAIKNIPLLTKQMQKFVGEIDNMQGVKFDVTKLTSFATAISRLGGKASIQAIENLPKLSKELASFMSELSRAPQVSENLIRMTSALANLARTGASSGRAAESLGKSFKITHFSSGNLKSTLSALGGVFKNLKGQILSLVGAFGGIIAVINGIKGAIDISSSVTEADNVVRQAFGKYESLVDNLCKVSIEKFGMSELSVKQFAGRFQSLGMALDIPQGKMAKMSIKLTELTGDMASFYDVSQSDVAKSLQSVFTGTTAPMRRYGVDLTQATLNEWLMKNGIDANVKSMNQAQKAMVRYQYVLERTKMAQGDFARTSDTWHNTLTTVKESFKDLGKTVGTVAINAFKPLLRVLGVVAEKVNSFVEMILNALGSIFGWKFEISKKGASGLADDLNSAAGGMDDLSDSSGDAAKNTGNAAKKAKDLKDNVNKAVRAFDELKTISLPDKKSNSGSGSGSGGSGGSGSGDGDTGTWVETPSAFETFKSSIKDLEGLGEAISGALINAMKKIKWKDVYAKAEGFGRGLAKFLNGLFKGQKGTTLFGELGRTIANALNTVLHALDSFGETFNWKQFGNSIADGVNKFFQNFDFALLAKTLNSWAQGAFDAVTTALSKISWKDVWKGVKDFLSNLDIKTVAIIIGALTIKKILGLHLAKKALEIIGTSISKAIAGSIAAKLGVEIGKNDTISSVLSTAISKKLSGISLGEGIAGTLATGFVITATIAVAVKFTKDFKEWKDNIDKYGWVGGRKKTARDNKANPYNNGNAITDKDVENYEAKAKKRANANSANPYNSNSKYSEKTEKIKNAANPYDTNSVKSHKTLEFQAKIKTKASELWTKLKSDWDKIKNKYADFKGRIKDNAKEWWENTKKYWSKKVGKVKEFTTDVKDSAKEWWDNTKKYWSQKVGQVKKFTTAVQNDASKWWSNTKKYWSEKVGKVKEFTTDVKNKAREWWSNVKKWWESTIAGKEVKKFTTNVKKAGGTWWKDVSNEWKEKVINAGRTLKIGISFAADALKNLWSSVSTFFSGKTVNVKTKGSTAKKADGGVFSGGRWHDIKRYAAGGVPNVGQLFWANEAGPELVGTLGGHTAVMNNDQIVASVSDGVAKAVAAVLGSNKGGNQPIQITLDGKVIFDSTREYANDFFRRTGTNPYPV